MISEGEFMQVCRACVMSVDTGLNKASGKLFWEVKSSEKQSSEDLGGEITCSRQGTVLICAPENVPSDGSAVWKEVAYLARVRLAGLSIPLCSEHSSTLPCSKVSCHV